MVAGMLGSGQGWRQMIEKDFAERQTMRDHPRLRHLTPHEREVLAEFLSQLREQCGDHITHVWLFGSKVRGDFDEESDVDLLIVAHEGDDALRKAIGEIAYDLSLKYGVLLCEHVVSAWRFAQMRARQEFIYKNVVGEGVDLWPPVIEAQKIAEEQVSYDTGSEEEDEDYGTYEDYLRERVNRAYEDIADARRSLDEGSYQWRERADYRFGVIFDEKTAREIVDRAERLIARLERFLCERGLLTESGER